MLGDTVRTTRIKKGLTQARLARLAGVSRRHLAALEKGANVSVNVLKKVASVLDLTEIHLGSVQLHTDPTETGPFNVPLLHDTIREARADADRAQTLLARAEGLLSGEKEGGTSIRALFPRPPVRKIARRGSEAITDGEPYAKIAIAGTIEHGVPVDESTKGETVLIPAALIDKGEIVFRVRGDRMHDLGIDDGDIIIVELRTRGRANTGEMVIAKIGEKIYIGRWWQKHERRAVLANGLSELAAGTADRAIKVVAVINQIVRGQ